MIAKIASELSPRLAMPTPALYAQNRNPSPTGR
jgi:hypothetical protein